MKRFRMIAAVALIGVLAGFPAMARVMCAEGMAAKTPCTPHCRSAKGAQVISCSMRLQAGRPGCDANCCQNGMQQGVFQRDSKLKPLKAELVAILPPAAVNESTVFANLPEDGRVDTGPPRYILFRVFRI